MFWIRRPPVEPILEGWNRVVLFFVKTRLYRLRKTPPWFWSGRKCLKLYGLSPLPQPESRKLGRSLSKIALFCWCRFTNATASTEIIGVQ
jgi:hypothetical protein